MVGVIFLSIFGSIVILILGLFFFKEDEAMRLKLLAPSSADDLEMFSPAQKKKRSLLHKFAFFNRPLTAGPLGERLAKDLATAQLDWSPEEFLFIKEILIGGLLILFYPNVKPDLVFFYFAGCIVMGYMFPEFWLKSKIKKIKNSIIRQLPDTVDLLGLCVNAGLDFMLAMKWVVEKSKPTVLTSELKLIMQEINVGKPRREALSDMAKKYEIPDLSTFTRTLIQADRMGTSVAEALNILSEDMRASRYRRGEQVALKAPLKMLIPLMLFIFPVVGILVVAPVLLDFMKSGTVSAVGSSMLGGSR